MSRGDDLAMTEERLAEVALDEASATSAFEGFAFASHVGGLPAQAAGMHEVAAFLNRAGRGLAPVSAPPRPDLGLQRSRMIFAMDATASREPTWDRACNVQAEMFLSAEGLGGLDVQLVHFRGLGDLDASPWYRRPSDLMGRMTGVRCLPGPTQIGRVLSHAVREARQNRVGALVYVGDSVEEDPARLYRRAGELTLLNVPMFIFYEETEEPEVTAMAVPVFQELARLTRGACCRLDSDSAGQLGELLRGAALFAAGGWPALADLRPREGGALERFRREMARRWKA